MPAITIKRSILVPLIVACAMFMEQMDSTVIATSLPMIARDLMEDPIALKLALTSYLVSLAVFIPISGWMADRFGARLIFRLAIGVFMVGSILCAVSSSLPAFVAARFFQGMGGAMMVPVGRLVILRTVSKAELVEALSWLSIPALLGPVTGPPLGGFITTYLNWRWIFFINIPISILGIYLATRFIEDVREEQVAPLDLIGFLLMGVGLSATMLGLATVGRHMISQTDTVLCIVVGALLLLVYVWHARRAKYPVLDLALFRYQTFRVGVLGGSLFRFGIGAIPFLLPLMLQLGFGLSPFHSGLLTCASAAGAMFMKTIARIIIKQFGFRHVLLINVVLGAVSLALIGLFTSQTAHWVMLIVLLLGGCFRSLQFTALNAISYADVPHREVSQATSISSVVQQLSMGMGVTIGAMALQASNALQGHTAIVAQDFPPAFIAVAFFAILSAWQLYRLPEDAGAEVAGRLRRG